MKKTLLALATLTAFAGVASAQSSVTVGGIMDVAARSVKNGTAGTIASLSSGGQATSRIYFRGVEDLGGGLKAGFWLESEIGADNGAAGSTVGTATGVFWGRRSSVSLMGGFGEVRLGRYNTSTFEGFNAVEIFGYVGVATAANLRGSFYSNAGLTAAAVRNSNLVTYYLPGGLGGLTGEFQVGAGENAANQNKSMAARLGYAAGPVMVSASYGMFKKDKAMTADLKTVNFGGTFNAGFAIIGALYEQSKYAALEQKLTTVNLRVPMGAGLIKAQYTKSTGKGNTATPDQYKATSFGLGYVHNLSKRSSLYASYGSVDNGGTATTGANFTATSSGPAGIKRGETSTGYEFGIRHDF